jgi:hypothetical protein
VSNLCHSPTGSVLTEHRPLRYAANGSREK